MRLRRCLRRVRHFSIIRVWPSIYRKFRWAQIPEKHIKIDDEENLFNESRTSRLQIFIPTMIRFLFLLFGLFVTIACMAYIIYKPPKVLIEYFQRKYPEVVFHLPLPLSQRFVALTLDDAPSPETPRILDLLNLHKVKVTFFVIGKQISDNPDILERIYKEGHEIGIHGWADEPSYKLPLVELEQQVKNIETMLPRDPDRVKWFRPGSGWFTRPMIEMLRSINYKLALGSVYPHDPQIKNPRINAAHVLSMVTPGAVIIMHDRRAYSYRQLELVLQGLKEDRWGILTLGKLQKLKMKHAKESFT